MAKKSKVRLMILIVTAFAVQFFFSSFTRDDKNHPVFTSAIELIVHYLDIGQADCILIQEPKGHTMLIDGGNEEDSKYIISYLYTLGIKKIDVLMATHPHEDHIGSMDDIVYSFEIGTILLAKVDYQSRSKDNFLEAVKKKGYDMTYVKEGYSFSLGDAHLEVLSPKKDIYDDLNYSSLVVKMNFSDVSFLFMGDAEGIILRELMDSHYDLRSDVIKIGHHGSLTSSPMGFIQSVSPKFAVISAVKSSRSYPHPLTLMTLKLYGVDTQVTDGNGTVVISTNGKEIRSYRSIYKNTDVKSLKR